MSSDFLDKIVAYKKELIVNNKPFYDKIKSNVEKTHLTSYKLFSNAISKSDRINLIAEIKKASPSKGLIVDNFDVFNLAKVYVENGADAISVLTEDKFFLGKTSYLKKVSDNFHIPVLLKDFIIDEGQIFEAFINGASAILLIAAILDNEQLSYLMKVGEQLGLDCLVEIHNEQELNRVLDLNADIIGINNRDLHTFEVSLSVCEKLIPKIPKEKIIVAESGIKSHDDIKKLKSLGANAVLIGETLLRSKDIGSKINELMSGIE